MSTGGRYVPLPDWLDLDQLAAVDVTDRGWRTARHCAGMDPDVFHPVGGPKGTNRNWALPARICAGCPARYPCLADWLASPPRCSDTHAYVGDTTPEQRRTIRLTQRREAAA